MLRYRGFGQCFDIDDFCRYTVSNRTIPVTVSVRYIVKLVRLIRYIEVSRYHQRSSMTKIFHSSTTAIPPLGQFLHWDNAVPFNGSSWQ